MQIQFKWSAEGLVVCYPNGDRFVAAEAVLRERNAALAQKQAAEQKLDAALAKLRELGVDLEEL